MSEDVAYILRIAGVGNGDGQWRWSTRALPYSVSSTLYAGGLSSVPDVLRHEVGVLDPIGSDAGIALSVVYSLGGSVLLDSRVSVARDTTGAVLRTAGPIAFGETALKVSAQPDLSSGDFVWVRGECCKVTGAGSSAGSYWSLPVSRGQLGTIAQNVADTAPGALVCTQWPGVLGARVTLSRVSMGATSSAEEEIIYRGVINGVTSRGPLVDLQIGSALAALRDTSYALPAAAQSGSEWGEIGIVEGNASEGVTLALPDGATLIPSDAYGWVSSDDVTHAWLSLKEEGGGGRELLALVGVTRQAGGAIRVTRLEQLQVDGRRVTAQQAHATLLGSRWSVTDSRLADTIAATTPAGIVLELLTGRGKPGARGGMSAEQVDSASLALITRVSRVETVGTGEVYSGASLFVMPYQDKPRKLREVLEDLLQPLGVSLAPGRDGRVRAIDWGQTTYGAATVLPSQLREALTGWSLSDANALREVTIKAERDGREFTSRIVSDLAANITTGGRVIEIDAGVWGLTEARMRAVVNRWSVLLSLWQRSAPEMELQVARSAALDVGDLVRLPIPSLVSWDGVRYDADTGNEVYAVVTGVSPRLRSPVDSVRVVAYGWGVTRADGVWGPAARVTGTPSGTITVGNDYTGADDALAFEVGMRIILCDSTGLRIDTTTPPAIITAISAGTITVPDLDARPSVGNILIPCDNGDQEADSGVIYGGTYWADDSDTQADASKGHYTYS